MVHEPARAVRVLRRTIAIVIVVAFSLAAVGGIIVLLGDIESDATFNVIWTTALTGAISVAAFCGATLIGRRAKWFGITTIALAVVTMALSLWFIWGDPYMNPDSLELEEILFQVLSSVALLTAVASVSSLILLLVPRSWVVRIGLPITLGLLALGTCLVLVTIWVESTWELEWLNRLNGIVWILAALGVVVVPLTSLLLKAGTKPAVASAAPSAPERAGSTLPPSTLSPSTLARLEAAAQAEGITADELVDRLLAVDPTPPDASATVSQSEPPRH
ncbi:hypothetical protein [Brevibacterium spongiae]|uniref:Uncharacterized protein n=1 Tax=Brevibacterium spongiae TaxID=2909672 RepID=A0ABY5SN80_9MICO|nr:hypothetical protein [Brevibacterium spongiae]UVI35755.1 hypothetical protein L1F31_16820 [Brevibacterium spongiae]